MLAPMTEPAERRIDTPLGPLIARTNGHALATLTFDGGDIDPARDTASPVLDRLEEELSAYFAGTLRAFDTPLAPVGTPFQQRVWSALRDIPYGQTRSYVDIARQIGCPGGQRAVGVANARNPIPILIPCHRVINARGALHGYGGGLWRKRLLLELEGVLQPTRRVPIG